MLLLIASGVLFVVGALCISGGRLTGDRNYLRTSLYVTGGFAFTTGTLFLAWFLLMQLSIPR